MHKDDLKEIKEGDKLLCIKGDWHFSKGDTYTVHRSHSGLEVWCDDIQPHWVSSLKPEMFKKVEEK